jgi:hypothetical protein
MTRELDHNLDALARRLARKVHVEFLHVQRVECLTESDPRRGFAGQEPIRVFWLSTKGSTGADVFRGRAALLPVRIVLRDTQGSSYRVRRGLGI